MSYDNSGIRDLNVVALAGGVGGARLARGLAACLPPEGLTVIVNTGDDFDLYGLRICPDLDTVMYTMAGVENPTTGWGIRDDSLNAQEMLARYGADTWFQLSDRDLATHLRRTSLLRSGLTLSEATREMSVALGVQHAIVPMSDDPVATIIQTDDGELDFQEYFVRQRHEPTVRGVRFQGIEAARPAEAALDALRQADLIVVCPSNPIVSIGPILAVERIRRELESGSAPVVAVSPIIGGRALKGPADRMLLSLGMEASAFGIAKRYSSVVQGMVIDSHDREEATRIESLGVRTCVTDTIMRDDAGRISLAVTVLRWGAGLRKQRSTILPA